MLRGTTFALLCGSVALLAGGCASSEEWSEWLKHPTHFASGQHMGFSLKNQGETPTPTITRRDLDAARQESWWGKVILVSPEQIFER